MEDVACLVIAAIVFRWRLLDKSTLKLTDVRIGSPAYISLVLCVAFVPLIGVVSLPRERISHSGSNEDGIHAGGKREVAIFRDREGTAVQSEPLCS